MKRNRDGDDYDHGTKTSSTVDPHGGNLIISSINLDAPPDDTLAALLLLRADKSMLSIAPLPLIVTHHIYTIVKDRTEVERSLSAQRNAGRVYIFRLATGVNDTAAVFSEDYVKKIKQMRMFQTDTVQESLTIFLTLLPLLRGLHVTHRRIFKLIIRHLLASHANPEAAPPAPSAPKRFKRPTVRRLGGTPPPPSGGGGIRQSSSPSTPSPRVGGIPLLATSPAGRTGGGGGVSNRSNGESGVAGARLKNKGEGGGHRSGAGAGSVTTCSHGPTRTSRDDEGGGGGVDSDSDSDDWDVPGSTVEVKEVAERHIRDLLRCGLLMHRTDGSSLIAYCISLPDVRAAMGPFVKAVLGGRSEAIAAIRRSRYKEITRQSLESRSLRPRGSKSGGSSSSGNRRAPALSGSFVVRDVIGAGLVQEVAAVGGSTLLRVAASVLASS